MYKGPSARQLAASLGGTHGRRFVRTDEGAPHPPGSRGRFVWGRRRTESTRVGPSDEYDIANDDVRASRLLAAPWQRRPEVCAIQCRVLTGRFFVSTKLRCPLLM